MRPRTSVSLGFAALFAGGLFVGDVSAQGVDRYQFLELQKQVRDLNSEVTRLRNAVSGGVGTNQISALEDENRSTGYGGLSGGNSQIDIDALDGLKLKGPCIRFGCEWVETACAK